MFSQANGVNPNCSRIVSLWTLFSSARYWSMRIHDRTIRVSIAGTQLDRCATQLWELLEDALQ
jgi:hypothetical protein